jgi:methionyl aminopeptidase
LVEYIKPGVKTSKLDEIAEEFIKIMVLCHPLKDMVDFQQLFAFLVNEQVVHGFPSDREIKEGDIYLLIAVFLKMDFMAILHLRFQSVRFQMKQKNYSGNTIILYIWN